MEKEKVTLKQTMGRQDAVSLLGDLLKSLKAGKVVVAQGERFLTLTPESRIQVEVEAKQKKGKGELSIQLSWKSAEEKAVEPEPPLKISSEEPALPEPEEGDEKAA